MVALMNGEEIVTGRGHKGPFGFSIIFFVIIWVLVTQGSSLYNSLSCMVLTWHLKWETTSVYLKSKNSCLENTESGRNLNQCSIYGVKARGFSEKRKGNNYINRGKEILLVLISCYPLAIHGCLLILRMSSIICSYSQDVFFPVRFTNSCWENNAALA